MQPCTEWIETMSAVLDGEAAPEQADALSAHLDQCPACAALFADLKALRAGADALLVKAPEGFTANVMAAVAAESAPAAQTRKKASARWRSWAAMAAVFALVVGVGARQSLLSASSSAPAVQDMAQPDTAARSGSTAGQEPAPQSAEPSYGAAPANTENAAGGSFKSAQPVPVYDSAQSEDLTDLRAAMELVVERICGESGYTLETEYVLHLSGLSPYCSFRLLDGERVIDEGAVTFTGLSSNERFYCFTWSWDGQSEEDALLYRYAVCLDLSDVLWAGDALDMDDFDLALER